MFGTLVVVLPTAHVGGELVIRHTGREVAVDLSRAEVSEVSFAAFYADCEQYGKDIAALATLAELARKTRSAATSLTSFAAARALAAHWLPA